MAMKNLNFDLNAWSARAQDQFRGLNPNGAGQWPILPKVTAFLFTAVAVVAAGWFVFLSGQNDELQAQRDREPQLKEEYRGKVAQAVNLGSCANSGSR